MMKRRLGSFRGLEKKISIHFGVVCVYVCLCVREDVCLDLCVALSDLKEQLRLVSTFGCEGSVSGDSGPVAHVVFFNNTESM